MPDVVESKQARRSERRRRRPWVRPVLDTQDVIETEKVPKFGAGTDAINSLS